MLEKIPYPSPNFEPRSPKAPLDLIVLHYTDMRNAQEALARLCDAGTRVSAHFLIHKEGTLYQLVDPIYCAWHAGLGSWQGETDINHRSIGIELDNAGHTFGPEPFSVPQMNTLADLLDELTKIYGISPHRIVGHSDIAPLRKKDPGALFPWASLARKGFGLWPFETRSAPPVSPLPPMDSLEIQRALSDIGYGCPHTGVWDEHTRKVCQAFQQHFTPHELTGYPSSITCQVLQDLLKVIKSPSVPSPAPGDS